MKIILSRKGFDSGNGGQPSPILPDGTLLSMPIPSNDSDNTYSTIMWNGMSYYEIIRSLKPRSKINNDMSWIDSSCYKVLKSKFSETGRDFSSLKSKYDYD